MAGDAFRGYAHVNVVVTDLDAAIKFYGEVLGLEKLPRPNFGSNGAWFRLGPTQLHLSVVDEMPDWRGSMPHLALYVPKEDFLPTCERLSDAGVEFIFPPRQREDFGVAVQAAFCRDPDGNAIELTDVAPFV